MSKPTAAASIDSLAGAFSAQMVVIPAASEQVIKDLTPLLSADSTLDTKITDALRNVVARFVETVKYTFVSSEHMTSGVLYACSLFTETGAPPTAIPATLKSMTENIYCAHANAQDALTGYAGLSRDVAERIKEILNSYDPDSVIKISAKDGVEENSLQHLSSGIINHLEGAEKSSSVYLNLLIVIKENLDAFLQDERSTPLSETRLWSPDMVTTWRNLEDIFLSFNEGLRASIRLYPSWYKWCHDNGKKITDADSAARLPQLTLPQFNVQTPEDTSSPDAVSPITKAPWLGGSVGPSQCAIHLDDIDQTKPGTSHIKASVSITPSSTWTMYLKRIYIYFEVKKDGTPLSTRFTEYRPRSSKEASSDPDFRPQQCKPALRAYISSRGELKWRFDRPFFRWSSSAAFPTNFALSFNLEHTAPVDLICYVVFVYKKSLTLLLTHPEQLYGTKLLGQPPPLPDTPSNIEPPTEPTAVQETREASVVPTLPIDQKMLL